MKHDPSFGHYSCVIRTHRSEGTLRRAIASLKMQTIPPTEIIVVDDNSTDETLSIAKDENCRVVHYPSDIAFNYSRALNLGCAKVQTPLIFNLSSHGILTTSDTMEIMIAELTRRPDACAAYLASQIDGRNLASHLPASFSIINLSTFFGDNGLSNAASLIRRSCWAERPFREDMPACEDQEWAAWQIRVRNAITLRFENPPLIYLNPHYSARKIARDYLVIGHFLQPDWISWRRLPVFARRAIRGLAKGNRIQTKSAILIAWWILIRQHRRLGSGSRYW